MHDDQIDGPAKDEIDDHELDAVVGGSAATTKGLPAGSTQGGIPGTLSDLVEGVKPTEPGHGGMGQPIGGSGAPPHGEKMHTYD